MFRKQTILLFAILGLTAAAAAQQNDANAEGRRYYRLDFNVKELEKDKVINSRAYSTTFAAGEKARASIRAGSRVPYNASPSPNSMQFQYLDLGVNIDASEARETGAGQWTAYLQVDITSAVIPHEGDGGTVVTPPVVRRTQWNSPVILPLKKNTTVFSSDDPGGNRKMQLDLLVTPIS